MEKTLRCRVEWNTHTHTHTHTHPNMDGSCTHNGEWSRSQSWKFGFIYMKYKCTKFTATVRSLDSVYSLGEAIIGFWEPLLLCNLIRLADGFIGLLMKIRRSVCLWEIHFSKCVCVCVCIYIFASQWSPKKWTLTYDSRTFLMPRFHLKLQSSITSYFLKLFERKGWGEEMCFNCGDLTKLPLIYL